MTAAFTVTLVFWIIVAVVAAMAAAAVIVTVERAVHGVRTVLAWRDAHASRVSVDEHAAQAVAAVAELPGPYQVSDETVTRVAGIIFCPVCRPGGHGKCTCPACCGDRQCGYGPPALFSAEEAAWLEGLGISEDEPEDCEYDQEGNEL